MTPSRRSSTEIVCAAFAFVLAAAGCGARTGLLLPDTEMCVATAPPGSAPAACDGGATTLSGTVYDPAGKNPLYNVVVYVPGGALTAFPPGVACDTCSAFYAGSPIAAAITDAHGHFVLSNVPAGADVPLVVQVGKWRRQILIENVERCRENPIVDGSLRLPANSTEGDLPNIAVSTGGADTLECLLLRMGVDASEYTGDPNGPGHVHIFQGSGHGRAGPAPNTFGVAPNTSPPGPRSYEALWDSFEDLARYDMVLMSCEGQETSHPNQEALFAYTQAGGRVFASHFHYAWFDTGPFGVANLATWLPGDQMTGRSLEAAVSDTLLNGAVFPEGQALGAWLANLGALQPDGDVLVEMPRQNAILSAANTASQAWLGRETSDGYATQDFSFDTPLGVSPYEQCGQVVYSDMHVSAVSPGTAQDKPMLPVPDECVQRNLSPQEEVLEFLIFNLSSCVTPANEAPQAPPTCQPL